MVPGGTNSFDLDKAPSGRNEFPTQRRSRVEKASESSRVCYHGPQNFKGQGKHPFLGFWKHFALTIAGIKPLCRSCNACHAGSPSVPMPLWKQAAGDLHLIGRAT